MSVDISKINGALVIICSLMLFLVMLLFFFVVLYRKRHNYFLKQEELMKARYEHAILQAQLEIQESTLTRISEEIHDNIGQVLSLVRLNLNTLKTNDDQEKLDSMDQQLGSAIQDMRNLSHLLNTNFIGASGLELVLRQLMAHLQRTGKFQTSVNGDFPFLNEERSIIVYRIVQELVTNILRHAGASQVSITANGLRKEIAVRDDGRGFIVDQPAGAGLGLSNVRNRARLISASITIQSKPGAGTEVTIHL